MESELTDTDETADETTEARRADRATAVVERVAEIDAPVDEVWSAVCDPTRWLADSGWLDLRPGGTGRLVDDGVGREVAVDVVEDGRRLVYRWWTDDEGPDGASRVEVTVVPTGGPTRVVIHETRPIAAMRAELRWDVRATCLAFQCAVLSIRA